MMVAASVCPPVVRIQFGWPFRGPWRTTTRTAAWRRATGHTYGASNHLAPAAAAVLVVSPARPRASQPEMSHPGGPARLATFASSSCSSFRRILHSNETYQVLRPEISADYSTVSIKTARSLQVVVFLSRKLLWRPQRCLGGTS